MISLVQSDEKKEEEARFRLRHAQRSVPFIRVSLPLAATLYLLFLGWDYYIDPASLVKTLTVRLPFSVFAIFVVGLTFLEFFQRWSQFILCLTVILGAVGIVLVLGILPNGFGLGISGLLLVIMYACGATRLLTKFATIACVVLIALTNGMLILIDASTFQFINTNVFIVSASLIGLAYTATLESVERRAFGLEEGERKKNEAAIYQLAFHDPLTGLPNRRMLLDRLHHILTSRAYNTSQAALLFIDIDNFKTLNDIKGHNIGDLLLVEIAHRLSSCAREGDTVARVGGDEFIVMLEGLSLEPEHAASQANTVAEKIRQSLNRPYDLKGYEHLSSCSIGISLFSQGGSAEDLLKNADMAMYEAKGAGRNTIRFFDPAMQSVLEARAILETDFRQALVQHQFALYFQIQVNEHNHPIGAEALVRWHHPKLGLVSPAVFIPLAEETGLILPLGKWVLEMACAQLKVWEQNALTRDLVLAVNVSAKEFRQPHFAAQVKTVLQRHAINQRLLKLELTESMLHENINETILIMREMKEAGAQFSLDDFGTGYSSLQYLKRLPLDQLKIDQSFVRDISTDPSDEAIVRTIVAIAQSLNLDVIAEGVETKEQQQLLLDSGCASFQGYLFGKPVAIEQFEESLQT